MLTKDEIKKAVQEKYGQIAEQSYEKNVASCCGATCGCSDNAEMIMSEDYSSVKGYVDEADLGLGCGLPTEFAKIKTGDTVVDLGSGAGNDCFVARAITGSGGKVIGVDFTPRMIEKARLNAAKLGYDNVEFRAGDIESLPLDDETADVVVSNCVLNLVPSKSRAFSEMFRILKSGGHFSVSDIVLKGELPDGLRKSAEMYAGCISGAIAKEEYLALAIEKGFVNVTVQKERSIFVPDEILSVYLSSNEIEKYRSGESGIFSITVYGEKP